MISLVLCTVERVKEVEDFFNSLVAQTINKIYFEVVVCDQNKDGRLDSCVKKYSQRFNILHIKSNVKGLSVNRNIGIKYANGKIFAFPDDDCKYYPNTLESVMEEFKEVGDGVLLGRIYDKSLNLDILKKWPQRVISVNLFNFYSLTTSITIFCKSCSTRFDEKFGVGAEYSSNEDTLYILENLLKHTEVRYVPRIEVWHPEQKNTKLEFDRVALYGIGFGKLLKKMPAFPKFYYYVLFNIYYLYRAVGAILSFNAYNLKWAFVSLCSRNRSFFQSDIN